MLVQEIGHAAGAGSGPTLLAFLRPFITEHPNWTFVKRVSDATYTFDVFRCGTLNAAGIQFYVILRANNASTYSLAMAVCETYDSGADTIARYAPLSNAIAPDGSADYTVGNTPIAITNLAPVHWQSLTASSSAALNFMLGLHDDLLVFVTNIGGAFGGAWVGVPETWFPGQLALDPFPLHIAAWGTLWDGDPQVAWGGHETKFTREPGSGSVNSFTGVNQTWFRPKQGRDLLTNNWFLSPISVRSRQVNNTGYASAVLRGLLTRDVLTGPAFGWGDRINVGADTYVHSKTGLWLKDG